MTGARKKSKSPLLTLSLLLAAIVGLELYAGPFFVPEAPSAGAASLSTHAGAVTATPLQSADISAYAEMVERPLFSPSRRPPPPAAAASAEPLRPAAFDLVGVIISLDRRIALLRERAATKDQVLQASEGQKVKDWDVKSIKSTQVELTRGSEQVVIKINDMPPSSGVNGLSVATTSPAIVGKSNEPAAGKPAELGVP